MYLLLQQHHQQHPSSTVTSESLLQQQQQQIQNGNEHQGSVGGAEMLNLAADSPDNKVMRKPISHGRSLFGAKAAQFVMEKELYGCNNQRMHLAGKTTFPSHFKANLLNHVTYTA